MSDRFFAKIEFGGALSNEAFVDIANAIAGEGARCYRTDALLGLLPEAEVYLRRCARENKIALLHDYDVPGTFQLLEPVLQQYTIPYFVDLDPRHGSNAIRRIWSTESGFEYTAITPDDSVPLVELEELRRNLANGISLETLISNCARFEPQYPPLSMPDLPSED